jgi:hypothetical protein
MILEFTCNGYYKDTKKETAYTLDIPADSDYPEYFKSLLEKGELNAAYTNNLINRALRELSWFKDIIFVQVTQIAEKRNYVFMVMLDWLTPDDHDTDYYLFNDYEKALDKFNSLIEDENDSDISWVGSEVFDENGEVNEGFELSCNTNTCEQGERNLYWTVSDKDKYRYSTITLTKKEIL